MPSYDWKVTTERTAAAVGRAARETYRSSRAAYKDALLNRPGACRELPPFPSHVLEENVWVATVSDGRRWAKGGGSSERIAVQRAAAIMLAHKETP